ncbi:MAG: Ger(x)C family spore germination protein [Firmicutes bacterium]|nr:Ger(x)C family spore germination protein [Bacillota bacterium]
MKKIIILLCILLLTGCYDYVEINDLYFISCIGIDYEDDKFKLTYEILNDTQKGSEQSSQEGFTISGSGKTLATAFDNISTKMAKKPYFYHLKAIVLSEDVAKKHTQEIIEFVTRNPEIRNEFYLTIAKDVKASDIVKNTTKSNPVVGNQITQLIDSNVKYFNITFAKPFEDILERFLNDKIDPIVNVLTLSGDNIQTIGIGLFDEYKYIDVLSDENSAYLNLLLDQPLALITTKNYKNKTVAINLYDGKVKYEITKNKIKIDIQIEGEISENLPNFDLRKEKTYIDLGKDFSTKLTNDIQKLIDYLVQENLDVIGLENRYYKKYRKSNKNILQNCDIRVDAKVTINKKGLIYEVQND